MTLASAAAFAMVTPLVVQALAMGFDEFYFHRKRGLGKWERVGHPLDTLSVVACLAWARLAAPTPAHVCVYIGLCVVSCLFVTKDEGVHARRCSAGEHWLHAILFVVHPTSLGAVAWIWIAESSSTSALGSAAPLVLTGQLVVTALFGLYQLVYWNVPWLSRPTSTQ